MKSALKGSMVITAGEAMNQACSLLRNIILARLLTKSDFGIAAMLGMTISLMDTAGRISIHTLIVQSKDGDQPRFMAVAHAAQVSLGVLSGLLIFVAAWPISMLFGVPETAWAFRVVAGLPVLKALAHLDEHRMVREMRFGASVLTDVIPQVVITLAAWPLAAKWPSYIILVWLLFAKQLASLATSHLVAERPYRWAYDPNIARSILTFGWPMLISSVLMFGITYGDRLAVGVRYTVADLGVYTVAGTLALLPAAALFRLSGSLLLPFLSAARDDAGLFRQRLSHSAETLALLSALYAIVMIVAGGPLAALLFGPKYNDAAILTAWLGLAQAVRLLRGVPTIASIARGDTVNLMVSNVWRLSGVVLAVALALLGASLAAIAACAAAGEIVALVGSFWRLMRVHRVPVAMFIPSCSLASTFIVASAVAVRMGLQELAAWIPLSSAAALALCLLCTHVAVFGKKLPFPWPGASPLGAGSASSPRPGMSDLARP
jgi:O-antigen/teichoic acid export membrane protein